MAAATGTGSLFGGGSAGFTFGSGTSATGFGTAASGGSNTLGFSAIKPFGATTTSMSTPFGKSTTTAVGTGSSSSFAFSGLGSNTGTSFSGLNTAKTMAAGPRLQTSQASQSSLFSLGNTPAATTGSGFTGGGLQTTSGLGGGLFTGSTTAKTTAATSLLPGPPPAASTGLGLGTTQTGIGTLSGFGAVKTATLTSGTTFAGLGGSGTSTGVVTTGTGVTGRQGDVKDTPLPPALNEIVEHIKKYVKGQKEHRDEISRVSGSTLEKVREETMSLRQTLALVSNSIQRDGCALENLKMDASQELKNAEVAQRTNDIPPALQHENTAPQEYFQRLVELFEERMLVYRKQIEVMESHLTSLSQGQVLTPQDLSEVMHKVHETFIALAAQLHEVHETVKVEKEHFLNYRRAYFKDSTDVFGNTITDLSKTSAEFSIGPSPFRIIANNTTTVMASIMNPTVKISLHGNKDTAYAPQTLGLSNLQTNPSGLTGGLGVTGTLGMGTPLGNPFGTPSALGTGNATVGTAFGTPLGTSTLGASGLGTTGGFGSASLVSAFGTPSLGASTTGTLNPSGAGVGGSGFGVGMSAFTAQRNSFQLQRPPPGNKRGKRR